MRLHHRDQRDAVVLGSADDLKGPAAGFGGTAAVWANCLLFFQSVLLAGYAYAHFVARYLPPRGQVAVHIILLALTCLVLPLAPDPDWRRLGAGNPGWGVFVALALSIGLPYFALSTTSPLIQAWFARTVRGAVPYRLYALSNLGSLAALLAYPVLIEPNAGTRSQLWGWSAGYVVFAVLCVAAAVAAGSRPGRARQEAASGAGHVAPSSFFHWLALAGAGSMMLVTVSNYLCQDLAPAPFLWVVPLALYLLSFVFCFDHDGWYKPGWFSVLLPLALLGMVFCFFAPWHTVANIVVVPLAAFAVFMFCHGELARKKPAPEGLTAFYVALSLGGAMGGAFVAVIAPAFFNGSVEYILGPELVGILAIYGLYGYRSKWLIAAIGLIAITVVALSETHMFDSRNIIAADRNFYGIIRVSEHAGTRRLVHGRVAHGLQFQDHRRRQPTSYYGPHSGAGVALNGFPPGKRRIGVIGLGVATVAAYGKAGDSFRFYEINPLVTRFAHEHFTFLRDCPSRVEIVSGDARIALEDEAPQNFDVLIVDAFSGDAIPVHLLTREAIGVYLRQLQPEGVLAFHISNAYLDLAPMVSALVRERGLRTALVTHPSRPDTGEMKSDWILATANKAFFGALRAGDARPVPRRADTRVWTDDYSNLLRVISR
ncbi:MAG TPA: fused MFS/spermidine synthase [Bryobacteraceae bacterium]|nr:fused MFS/spermidine synthase [Bryobacteraceae bacterium]